MANFREFPFRDCPKRVGGACCVALRSTETLLFGPFLPPYTSKFTVRALLVPLFGQSLHALGRIRYRGIAAGKNSWPLHLCLPVCEYGTSRRARKRTATERRRKEDDARSDEGSGVARGTGRTSARGVRGGMRAGSRPGPSPARGEEEGGGWPGGPEEEGRRPEEEGGGRPGGLGEKGGRCAEGRKRPPEEGKRAAEEDIYPTAAEPEGEEVDVRLVRECVLYAYFNAETEKAKLAEHHLPELPRTPLWRSSQNSPSTHSGE